MYDVLANRQKLTPVAPIGTLTAKDSAVCTAISLAADQLQVDTALELAEAAMDGLGVTLLSIYRQGLPPGGKLANPYLAEVCEILARAGEHDRREADTDSTHADERPDSTEVPAGSPEG